MKTIHEFHLPKTVDDAIALLQRPGAVAVAGGTDVAVHLPEDVEILVDVTRLGWNDIRAENGVLSLGATVTMHDLISSEVVRSTADGMLSDAAGSFISRQIRNAATLGGNLAAGAPAADLPPALLALDAVVHIRGAAEERAVPLSEFFTGPGQTVLKRGLLTRVTLPHPEGRQGSFLKVGRTAEDLAIVNTGVSLRVEDGRCHDVRIALGAVGETSMRILEAEALLEGEVPSAALLADAADTVRERVRPVDDHRAGAAYRGKVSGVLARRGLETCLQNAGLLSGEG